MERVEANEWIAENYPDATICYKLAAPILIDTIDPITINSLIGQNNIWSTADTIEAEYYFLESLDIYKQRFKANEPHLEVSTGNIANFSTDMVSHLKSVKLNFSPLQEGSGDPSPDNIRSISGWNNINLYQTSNILIPNETPSKTSGGITWSTNTDGSIYAEGEATSASWYSKSTDPTYYIKGGVTYSLSGGTTNVGLYLTGTNLDGTSWSEAKIGGTDFGTGRIFTLDQDAFVRWQAVVLKGKTVNETIYPKLTIVNTSDVFEPYSGSTTSITLPETIYGGYIDAVQGKLVVEWGGMRKKLSEASYQHDSTGIARYSFNNCIPYGQIINTSRQICNVAEYSWNLEDRLTNHFYGYYTSSTEHNRLLLFLLDGHGLSDDTYVEFAAPFSAPVEFDIDSITLKTLKGTNNIWSNANGNIQTKYWTHGSLATTKKVVWNNLVNGYLSADDWIDRNSSDTTTTFENGIATTQFVSTRGAYYTMISKTSHTTYQDHKYYCRFDCMVNTEISSIGMDIANIAWYKAITASTNEWDTYSNIVTGQQDRSSTAYIPRMPNNLPEGTVTKSKNILIIDLTLMFGAGNEPSTTEEFETLCIRNGIDFTQPQPQNAGTEMYWYF